MNIYEKLSDQVLILGGSIFVGDEEKRNLAFTDEARLKAYVLKELSSNFGQAFLNLMKDQSMMLTTETCRFRNVTKFSVECGLISDVHKFKSDLRKAIDGAYLAGQESMK